MKRGAERQLTKDDDPEESSEGDSAQGFQRADKKAIAARPMKGLPRRAGMSNPAPPVPLTPSTSVTPEPSAPASKFSGFSGFGATTAATTPFSFAPAPSAPKPAPPPPAATTPAPVSAFAGFGSSAFPPSSSSPSLTTPAVSSTASAATKTFASFFSTPPTPASAFPAAAPVELKAQPQTQAQNGRTSAAAATSDSKDTPAADDAILKAETTYYTALRGLNVSLLKAATNAVDADPFTDLTSVLERYKTLRQDAKADFDAAAAAASTSKAAPASKSAPIAAAAFDFSKPPASGTLAAPTSAFSMPKPPSSFAGFSVPAASSTAAASTGAGGFVPSTKIPTTLTFGPGASSASTLPKSAFPASSSTSSPFGSSSGAKIGSGSGAFSFGSGSETGAGTDTSKTEGSGAAKSAFFFGKTSAPAVSPSVFSSNLFGVGDSSDDKEKEKDKEHATEKADGHDKAGEKDTKESKAGASSFFAAPAGKPSPFLFSTPSSSTPPATAAAPTTPEGGAAGTGAFGGFGKPAGSFGNPVGWEFASPPRDGKEKDTEKDAGGAAAAETTTKGLFGSGGAGTFGAGAGTGVFGGGATASVFGSGAFSASAGTLGSAPKLPAPAFSFAPVPAKSAEASSGETTPAPEDAPPPLETRGSVHDLPGEGEEDEDTAHEVRSKVYKLVKNADGVPSWSDLGVGLLKVKVHKESGTRRVLLRNSSTGKVTVNFNIYKSMDPSVSKNTIAFIGHEAGETVSYRLRVKTHDLADGLKTALDREIEFVKGKAE